MESTQIKVDGMSCGGCVKNVTSALQALEGVTKVEVSLENAQAVVEFDPARVQRADLLQAIDDAGFDAA